MAVEMVLCVKDENRSYMVVRLRKMLALFENAINIFVWNIYELNIQDDDAIAK